MGVANRNADLPDPPQTFLDQALMATVEWLIAADEKRRRLLRIECWTQPCQRLFGPILWCAFRLSYSHGSFIPLGSLGRIS